MKAYSESDLQSYLDQGLDAQAMRAFEEALRQEAALRKQLLVLAHLAAEMPRALAEENAPEASATPPDGDGRARPAWRRVLSRAWPLAAAAALVAAYLLYTAATRPTGARQPAPPPDAQAAAPQPAVTPLPAIAGTLTEIAGEVRALAAGGAAATIAAAGTAIPDGATITLATNATALAVLTDGSRLRLYRNTIVTLDRTATGPCVELVGGSLDAAIQPRPSGSNFVFRTPLLRAEVLGTEFRLMADAQSAWIGVREGRVRVTHTADGKRMELTHGCYAVVKPGWPFSPLNAMLCPVWKSVCQHATGTSYP